MAKKAPRETSGRKNPNQNIDNTGKFKDDIVKCSETLKNGGIILFPTETGWAIGCDATNDGAVNKIKAIIPQLDEFEVLIEHIDRLGRLIRQIPDIAIQLIEVNDKPMTLIYPGAVNLAPNVLIDGGAAAIRIAGDDFCRKLISSLNRPILSAAIDSEPLTFREIPPEISSSTDYIVKWRQNDPTPGVASSLIKVGPKGEIEIIKP